MRAANVDTVQKAIVKRCSVDLACQSCGKAYRRKASFVARHGSSYCSRDCMKVGYSGRMKGAGNPNFRDLSPMACIGCGVEFHSYDKGRKYCSQGCFQAANIQNLRAQAHRAASSPKPAARRDPLKPWGKCSHCGADVFRRNTQTCSKVCANYLRHERMWDLTMKYGARKDLNHKEVFGALESCGIAAYDLSAAGMGVPDGVAWVRGEWRLIEVKNPKNSYGRRGMNNVQKRWISQWRGGPVFILKTVSDAIKFASGDFGGLDVVTPESAAIALLQEKQKQGVRK